MTDVTMPRLSDSMEEGTVLEWLVAEGAEVRRGDPLVEIETDKANMTYEADVAGTLLEIVAPAGATLAIGEPIARIGDPSAAAAQAPVASNGRPQAEVVRAPASPAAAATAPGTANVERTPARAGGGRVKASPLARRIARDLGVDLAAVSPTGPNGRVVKRDVETAAQAGVAVAAPQPQPAPTPAQAPPEPARADSGAKGAVERQELSRLQQTVARRMAEAKATVPEFSISLTVDMTQAVELRGRLKQVAQPAPSLNDLVVKAAALALREHPRVNAAYRDGAFELYERVNVGVAVAAEDALVVPTVFDADRKSLGAIARETRALAERVREQTITPPELSGATLTVSNLGMFGVEQFTAIVNVPQAAILAVGAMVRRPAVDAEDRIVARDQMSLTLVSDHRILYGADAARMLARVRELLEQPLGLAL